MKTPLRCGVVGVGFLGKFHCEKYQKVNGATLVALCDKDPARAQQMGEEFKVFSTTNPMELLKLVDAVTIAADTLAHYELASLFLNNGIHVNVEKPMTTHSKEAKELVNLARKNDLKLQVGHVERFNSAFLAAKERLVKPLFIECHRLAPFKSRSMGVDVVLDLMIHDLDVVLSLVPSQIKSVSAVGTPVITPNIDIANARLEFESGTVANITSSRVSKTPVRKFRVFQPDQYLSMDFGTGEISLTTKNHNSVDEPLKIESWSLQKGDALLSETQSFVDAILSDRNPVVSGEDGLVAIVLAEQILSKIHERYKK